MKKGEESLRDCLWSQSRTRRSPAFGPEISDDNSEGLLCRPYPQKVQKFSNGSEDEPTPESNHRSLIGRNMAYCEGNVVLNLGDNARSSNYQSSSSPSRWPRDRTQAVSETSVYETLLQSSDPTLI